MKLHYDVPEDSNDEFEFVTGNPWNWKNGLYRSVNTAAYGEYFFVLKTETTVVFFHPSYERPGFHEKQDDEKMYKRDWLYYKLPAGTELTITLTAEN